MRLSQPFRVMSSWRPMFGHPRPRLITLLIRQRVPQLLFLQPIFNTAGLVIERSQLGLVRVDSRVLLALSVP